MANDTTKSDRRGSKYGAFETVLSFIERTAKVFTVFVGTIYVIGYIVTATRLAQYGVSATTLIDAQYLVAGLLPGLLLWLTILVLVSAFSHKSMSVHFYDSHRGDLSLTWVGLALVILLVIAFAVEIFAIPFSRNWSDFRRSLLNTSYIAAKFILGELALWFSIVGLRTKYFSKLSKLFKAKGEESPVWISIVVFFVLAAIGLYQIPRVAWMAYNGLPQAYGGGKLLRIELYVDSNKVASELLVAKSGMDQGSLARTIPLNLILRTSTEYIVYPLEDSSQRAWVVKADVVYAEHIIEGSAP